jgi:hypothetical protein
MSEPWRDELELVRGVDRDYPGLIRSDPHAFLDQAIHRLNRKHHTDRFGRKRKNDGSWNDDVVTYRMTERPQDKKLIDVIGGDARVPMWDVRPAHEEPGNGTWAPAQSPDRDVIARQPDAPPVDNPPPVDLAAVLARLDLMEKRAAIAQAETQAALANVAAAVAAFKGGPVVFPNYAGTARLGTTMRFTLEPVK